MNKIERRFYYYSHLTVYYIARDISLESILTLIYEGGCVFIHLEVNLASLLITFPAPIYKYYLFQ